jgi:hypothetical protein
VTDPPHPIPSNVVARKQGPSIDVVRMLSHAITPSRGAAVKNSGEQTIDSRPRWQIQPATAPPPRGAECTRGASRLAAERDRRAGLEGPEQRRRGGGRRARRGVGRRLVDEVRVVLERCVVARTRMHGFDTAAPPLQSHVALAEVGAAATRPATAEAGTLTASPRRVGSRDAGARRSPIPRWASDRRDWHSPREARSAITAPSAQGQQMVIGLLTWKDPPTGVVAEAAAQFMVSGVAVYLKWLSPVKF